MIKEHIMRNAVSVFAILLVAGFLPQAAAQEFDDNQFEVLSEPLYECIYSYRINVAKDADAPVTEVYNTLLQVGSSCAKFCDYTTYWIDSLAQRANVQDSIPKEYMDKKNRSLYHFDAEIYQNYPQGKMTTVDIMAPNIFTYQEAAFPVQWELTQDTTTVCGYVCNKAVAEYGGRKWTAWYAADIPVPYGPWKFTGLPGLVLAATDSEGIHSFTAISFRKSDGIGILKEKNARLVTTDRSKFIKNKNSFEQDPMNNIPIEAISQMEVVKYGPGPQDNNIFINGVRLRIRPNGYLPLELK